MCVYISINLSYTNAQITYTNMPNMYYIWLDLCLILTIQAATELLPPTHPLHLEATDMSRIAFNKAGNLAKSLQYQQAYSRRVQSMLPTTCTCDNVPISPHMSHDSPVMSDQNTFNLDDPLDNFDLDVSPEKKVVKKKKKKKKKKKSSGSSSGGSSGSKGKKTGKKKKKSSLSSGSTERVKPGELDPEDWLVADDPTSEMQRVRSRPPISSSFDDDTEGYDEYYGAHVFGSTLGTCECTSRGELLNVRYNPKQLPETSTIITLSF